MVAKEKKLPSPDAILLRGFLWMVFIWVMYPVLVVAILEILFRLGWWRPPYVWYY
jgi:hypothetical protein